MLENAGNLSSGTVCIAQQQTHGRGSQGRRWLSGKKGESFLCSWLIKKSEFPLMAQIKSPTIVFSLLIIQALEDFFLDLSFFFPKRRLQILWPNDIIVCECNSGKIIGKIGGVLIESKIISVCGVATKEQIWVTGVGINWLSPDNEKDLDLFSRSGAIRAIALFEKKNQATVDPKQFLPYLIGRINSYCKDYPHNQTEIWQEINRRDSFSGKELQIADCLIRIKGIHVDGSLNLDRPLHLKTWSDQQIKEQLITQYLGGEGKGKLANG